MSCIEKMTIQGIRSFGSETDDKQQISFFTPLTLILGPNGTGKTTIIECLKYITTGDLPPGGKQNAAFIHDPKIANETEVNAKVCLQFRDVRGKKYVSQRSILATQKPKKVEMKTLEGVISTMDRNTGKWVSISSKCAEMDREMVSLLGVAKPILDSVIFCHQEDANWPLSEGKALKARFDDIFASTRYVKCLDQIRKTAKDMHADINLYKNDIKYLKVNKDKAAKLEADKSENETSYLACKENIAEIKVKMEPIKGQLEKIQSRGHEIYKIQNQKDMLEAEVLQIQKAQKELRRNIKHEFKGSIAELKQELHDFESKVEEKEVTLRQQESTVETLMQDLEEVSDEKETLLVEQGVLRDEAQRYKKNVKARDSLIAELAERYNVAGFSGALTDAQVNKFLKVLKTKKDELEKELQDKRAAHEKKEREHQTDIDELRNTKTKLETELTMKQDTLYANRTEIKAIKQELLSVDASAENLKGITRNLKKTEHDLEETEKSTDLDALKAEVRALTAEKSVKDIELKSLDEELNRLSRESTVRGQLDHYKKDKTAKLETSRKLKSKVDDSMKHLLGHMPSENLRRLLDQRQSKLSRDLRASNDQLQKLNQEKTQKETQCKMQKELLSAKEKEFRGYEDRLSAVTGGEKDFDTGLEKLQESLRLSQDEKGNLKGVQYMYKKYEDNLSKGDNAPCPLCHRPFDQPNEIDELISEIQQKMNLVPGRLDRANTKIGKLKHDVEEMIQLKPIRAAMLDLESEDIPNLKQKIRSLEQQISKLQDDITDKEDEVETLITDENMAQNIHSDVTMIDQLHNELRDLDKKISQQAAMLSGGEDDRSMEQVQDLRGELQDKIEIINRNLDRKRQKQIEQSERIQHLKSEVNRLNGEKLKIEKGIQQRTRLEENKATLEATNETLDREIQDGQKEIVPLQQSVQEKERQKHKITRQKEKDYDEGMKLVNKVNDEAQDLVRHNNSIESYLRSGKEEQLEQSDAEIEKAERKAAKFIQKKDAISAQINQAKDDLAMQKMQERELKDNLSVHQKQIEIEEKMRDVEALEAQLGGLDVENLDQERKSMQTKFDRFLHEVRQAESRQMLFEDKIKYFRNELRDDMFRDAEKKYREKMIALKTTELANGDLDKYYKALDRTIMSYHRNKMAEINKIIRELWRNTYKGNDIETIEIRSDVDEASGLGKARRQYNYGVSMIRSGVAIDMRNRCSAGQKVLASLIIRLALAETFCINCGILALDEPTTNLDRENIESLAYALVEIIKSRSRQRNFQLVIITHDEDFVELLGRSDYVEHFFKVRKNEYGCSRLVKARVEDLHSR